MNIFRLEIHFDPSSDSYIKIISFENDAKSFLEMLESYCVLIGHGKIIRMYINVGFDRYKFNELDIFYIQNILRNLNWNQLNDCLSCILEKID
jgi:hypothetical protein